MVCESIQWNKYNSHYKYVLDYIKHLTEQKFLIMKEKRHPTMKDKKKMLDSSKQFIISIGKKCLMKWIL